MFSRLHIFASIIDAIVTFFYRIGILRLFLCLSKIILLFEQVLSYEDQCVNERIIRLSFSSVSRQSLLSHRIIMNFFEEMPLNIQGMFNSLVWTKQLRHLNSEINSDQNENFRQKFLLNFPIVEYKFIVQMQHKYLRILVEFLNTIPNKQLLTKMQSVPGIYLRLNPGMYLPIGVIDRFRWKSCIDLGENHLGENHTAFPKGI